MSDCQHNPPQNDPCCNQRATIEPRQLPIPPRTWSTPTFWLTLIGVVASVIGAAAEVAPYWDTILHVIVEIFRVLWMLLLWPFGG
ncbi:hypothetical protein ACH5AL_15255 [Actinacidiphila glaucinigra]|uniref:hypothetical protein n=1 Tax=Actinacidiphila glaucinigra TaxID=235986 RepID=UPI003797E227